MNTDQPVADRTPKKKAASALHVVVTPPSADSLPDPPPTCQSLHRNVVQFTRAITPSALPVTDEVRDRIYRDWMRGVPMVDLAVVGLLGHGSLRRLACSSGSSGRRRHDFPLERIA